MSFLSLENVSKSFAALEVLSNVSLEVEEGELVAIVGFSGAGKSTLISLLSGLIKPDSGRVLFRGKPVTGPGPDRGVVFQNYSLLPWLTAFENVYLAVDQVYKDWSREKKVTHTQRYIRMVGLGHAGDRKPAQLSGGMRQRVALARGLSTEPGVLLMDEPLSALDALTRATLQDEIGRIVSTAGTTIVLVTNDVDEAALLADRIVPLSAGPRATLGPPTRIECDRPRDRRALQKDPVLRQARKSVTEFLLESRRARRPAAAPTPATDLAPTAAPPPSGESPAPEVLPLTASEFGKVEEVRA
jgi:nitrate/nitrite transport system ATP-binding protein